MLSLHWVNLVQVSALTLLLLGVYLLKDYKHYRLVEVFFGFLLCLVVANIAEEVFNTREWYLVSPIFIVGYGPMFYLVARSLVHQPVQWKSVSHFLPMILALFFTDYPQWVIGVGTLFQTLYTMLSIRLVLSFNNGLAETRSDSDDLSLTWFAWLAGISAASHIIDLVRLNLQPYISTQWNVFGQLLNTILGVLVLAVLLKKLIQYNDGILSLIKQRDTETPSAESQDLKDDFSSIFAHIDTCISEQHLYRQPRLSLTDLSHHTGLQSRDISRAININGGVNFNDYINRFRVNDVKKAMTCSPDASVLSLALDAGFNSKTSFNTTFKRLIGETPSEFKKNHIKS